MEPLPSTPSRPVADPRRRRIGISLLGYSPRRLAGAGVFTMSLTRELVRRSAHEYVLFVPRAYEALWRNAVPASASFVVCRPHPDHRVWRVIFELLQLPRLARRHQVHTVFFPLAVAPLWKTLPAVGTVYDLLLLSKKTDFEWYKRLYLSWRYRALARSLEHIVTISEFCRQEIVQKLRVAPARVTVVSPAVDREFIVDDTSDRRGLTVLSGPYLLSVAGAYPHKRLAVLLEAFQLIASERPDLHLVFAGTHTGTKRAIRALRTAALASGLGTRIHFLPPLSRTQLPPLLAGAATLVSASEFEGFCLPVLEAMAVGCPVAATPAQAVVEVLGEGGWVAPGFSASDLADTIRAALFGRTAGRDRIATAQQRALTRYTWAAAAAVLEELLARL